MEDKRLPRYYYLGILLISLGILVLGFGMMLFFIPGPDSKNIYAVISGAVGCIILAAGVIFLVKFQNLKHQALDTPDGLVGTLLSEEKPVINVDFLPVPPNFHVEKNSEHLLIRYSKFKNGAYLLLVLGLIFLCQGLIFFLPGSNRIIAIVSLVGGFFAIYFFLLLAINRETIKVTHDQLIASYKPLPLAKNHKLECKDLLQLYTYQDVIYSKSGRTTYNTLKAVLAGGRQVSLVSEASYEPIHFIELQVEDWLGIKDMMVAGEAELP